MRAAPVEQAAIRAATGLAERVLGADSGMFTFELIPPDDGRDVFELLSRDGKIVIRGNSGVAMATGLNWYLKYYCKSNVSWCGTNLNLPKPLPALEKTIRKSSWAKHRYFLNYVTFGYSLTWWTWEEWEWLIDWMALNGINLPLSITGQEAVWQATCRRLGMSDEQIANFLAGPPYLGFMWMGCLDGWGGPLPQSWIDGHEKLGKQILARQRELGMQPVLQGYIGLVPETIQTTHPDAKTSKIHWTEFSTHLLDPQDPLFQEVADIFMEEQEKRFGTSHMYAADPFIEMIPPSGELDYLDRMGKALYNGMAKTDEKAVWVLQGWPFTFKHEFWKPDRIKAFLDSVSDERMLVLDLFCETKPAWEKTEAFYGKPWLWCNVQNFGSRVFLGGYLPGLTAKHGQRPGRLLSVARNSPGGGNLVGLGMTNEGLGYNTVFYDLLFEAAWEGQGEAMELDEWVRNYAVYRYGQDNADVQRAWRTLQNSVYRGPVQVSPSMITRYPYMGNSNKDGYKQSVAEAWRDLLKASDELENVDTYRFDLVNVSRQALSMHAVTLHRQFSEAYKEKNADVFQKKADAFLQIMLDMDELLTTRKEFLLGAYLESAKAWGTTPEEKAIFEWNARRILTLWGATKRLNDYSNREWSGMISGYYYKRWKGFLDAAGKALRADTSFDIGAFSAELMPWMQKWSDGKETYPSQPKGDSIAIVKKLWEKYGNEILP